MAATRTKPKKQNGYVLVDALVTVMIATLCFTSVMGGINTVANLMAGSRARIQKVIIEHNEFEKTPRIEDLEE